MTYSDERRKPRESTHLWVPMSQAMDYVLLGWVPLPSLDGTSHGQWAVHMAWICECEAPFLSEARS